MAAVVRSIAPLVSLYVNDYNESARAAGRRVGFTETAGNRAYLRQRGDGALVPGRAETRRAAGAARRAGVLTYLSLPVVMPVSS
jgi:hypothetical protein